MLSTNLVVVFFCLGVCFIDKLICFIFYFFIIYLLEANYFIILYWFCLTLTWIRHGCTCVPILNPPAKSLPIPSLWVISVHQPWAPYYHASNLEWRCISHMIIYMFQCHYPNPSHPRPLPHSPKDCSIHLCLFSCFTNRVIITIFLNFTYMH